MAPHPAETTEAAFLVGENNLAWNCVLLFLLPGVLTVCQTNSFCLQPSCLPSQKKFCVNTSAFIYEQYCLRGECPCFSSTRGEIAPTITFFWLAVKMICPENMNFQEFRAAYKFKCDLAHLLQRVHRQSTLFLEFPVCETDLTSKQAVGEQKSSYCLYMHIQNTQSELKVKEFWLTLRY